MGHLALVDMAHIQYRPSPFHIDTISEVSLHSMNNCGLNPADKRFCLRSPMGHLALADMAHMQSRTYYIDATYWFSSNSVQKCGRNLADIDTISGRNLADKEVSTD